MIKEGFRFYLNYGTEDDVQYDTIDRFHMKKEEVIKWAKIYLKENFEADSIDVIELFEGDFDYKETGEQIYRLER